MLTEGDLLGLARRRFAAGQISRAAALASVLVYEVEPNAAAGWDLLGRIQETQGKIALAVVTAAQAAALAPVDDGLRQRFHDLIDQLSPDEAGDEAAGGALLRRLRANPMTAPAGGPFHIVNPMTGPFGEERNALSLAARLRREHRVRVWASADPAPAVLDLAPKIRRIGRDGWPKNGTVVLVGPRCRVGGWLRKGEVDRVVLLVTVYNPLQVLRCLGRLARFDGVAVSLAFVAPAIARLYGFEGPVLPSFIDLERFRPTARDRPFRRVGRLSRDDAPKHHPKDPALYHQLGARGLAVRVMGVPDDIAEACAGLDRFEALPMGAVPAERFLAELDAFVFRTGTVYEAFGRVIAEAMAAALPVVVHRAGGYAERIADGESGYLFDTNDEAVAAVERLAASPAERRHVGAAARASVETLYGSFYDRKLAEIFGT